MAETLRSLADGWRRVTEGLILLTALGLVAASVAACLGALPWPELALSWGGAPVPQAGVWLQLGVTALFVALCFHLPANRRMARLEASHRSFSIGMDDVAAAYVRAHAADRKGAFALSGEFESVKTRFDHLKTHPDLAELEPELLELAAKMSHISRDLARTYAADKVARAQGFLAQRQEEVHMVSERIATARRVCADLKRWLSDVEAEERQAEAQIARLEADLREVLPEIGYMLDHDEPVPDNVVSLPVKQP
ncbi:DNA repair protein [Rhodobacteraceae bacterium CYK-10]|uniref:DNA repair protein n=2 Tax=Stagnihabitans tardus TaxID=2699202 RepID=A0AAE5BW07_9RHOB|nr:DNA repair protein [Stagnihabitans tardus]